MGAEILKAEETKSDREQRENDASRAWSGLLPPQGPNGLPDIQDRRKKQGWLPAGEIDHKGPQWRAKGDNGSGREPPFSSVPACTPVKAGTGQGTSLKDERRGETDVVTGIHPEHHRDHGSDTVEGTGRAG